MINPMDHYLDILFRRIREAGFEDGSDFSYEKGPESISSNLDLWLKQNSKVLKVEIAKEMKQRGFKVVTGRLTNES